jgi:hypothetical protein
MHARFTHTIASALAASALAATPLAAYAQTVGGQIVGLESGKPVHGASIALVDDSANVVSSGAADTASGMFYVDAPHAGHYRVVLFANGGSFVSPAMQVDSAQTVERKFSVPDVPGVFRNAYFARDVTTPARLLSFRPMPRYPDTMSGSNADGLVVTMFVVDEHGHVDPSTVQVINGAGFLFAKAVRESLHNAVYMPAVKDGVAVRQVEQLSVGFGGPSNTPHADIMISTLGITRPIFPVVRETTTVLVGRPNATTVP